MDAQYDALAARLSAASGGAALFTSDINACTNFALDATDAGRADLSIRLLEPLSVLAPTNAKVWQVLGLAYRDEQMMAEAVSAFAMAASLAPKDPLIRLGQATVALETGLPSAGLFREVQKIAPGNVDIILSAASALDGDGQPDAADALLFKTLEAQPGWIAGHQVLASKRWSMGRAEDFTRSYDKAMAAQPANVALVFSRYRAVSGTGQWLAAREVITQGRARHGDLPEFDALEAHILSELGDIEGADRLFARAAALDDPGVDIQRIRHALRTGRYDDAEAIGLKLIALPGAEMVWPYMSLIWRLKGDARAAWLDGDPPYVKQFDLGLSDGELGALANVLRGLHTAREQFLDQSVRGGTQTDKPLFNRQEPEIRAIRARVVEAVREYADGLPPYVEGHPLLGTPRGRIAFSGSWSVRLRSQGFHVAHHHQLGWISSALYVALPQHMGPPPSGWLEMGSAPTELGLDIEPYMRVEPKPGRLAMFPSTMFHGTVPFDDGERLTIAYDVAVPVR